MDIDWTSLVIKFNNELLYVINIFKVFLLSSLFDICEGWGGGGTYCHPSCPNWDPIYYVSLFYNSWVSEQKFGKDDEAFLMGGGR